MAEYILRAQYVEGQLVNLTVTNNNPIVVYSLQAPGTGTMRLQDLRDVDGTAPSNGQVLTYNTGSGTWGPVALAGGGDMLAATYDSDANSAIDLEAGGLNADVSAFDGLLRIASGTASAIKINTAGTAPPTAGDDTGDGYSVGSMWFDTTNDKAYVCLDATGAAAVWTEITVTASGTLANIVEDTTPQLGGQLDGNGYSIFIDDFASGGYIIIGTSPTTGGNLSYVVAATTFYVQSLNAIMRLSGANGLELQASAGDVFSWPSADGSAGDVMTTDGGGALSLADPDTLISAASTTVAGKVELATITETNAGTDTGRAVTPDSLAGSYAGTKSVSVYCIGATTDVTVGDGKAYITIPASLALMNLVSVHARVITAGTTGTTDVQIYSVSRTSDLLSTKITIDSTETGSETAATAPGINTAVDDMAGLDLLRIDVDAVSTTPPKGLIVTMEFQKP